jgi:NADPH:quinone reductase-like Zn-dependent oxidoreductase
MRLEEAAAISLCGLTAAQAIFFRMSLDAPFQWQESPIDTTKPEGDGLEQQNAWSFFIYGASTSVAMYAAQLVRQSAEYSGRFVRLFGAASPKHFQMLRAEPYCYDKLVDYHSDDWPTQILDITHGQGVDYAYDCISGGSTVADTGNTLASSGKMAIVRSREGGAWSAKSLRTEPSYGAAWEGLGETVEYQGMSLPASPEARAFAGAFYRWLSGGTKLVPNPIRAMPGGLEAIVDDGFRLLGSGTMEDRKTQSDKDWMTPLSAQKMVYKIAFD